MSSFCIAACCVWSLASILRALLLRSLQLFVIKLRLGRPNPFRDSVWCVTQCMYKTRPLIVGAARVCPEQRAHATSRLSGHAARRLRLSVLSVSRHASFRSSGFNSPRRKDRSSLGPGKSPCAISVGAYICGMQMFSMRRFPMDSSRWWLPLASPPYTNVPCRQSRQFKCSDDVSHVGSLRAIPVSTLLLLAALLSCWASLHLSTSPPHAKREAYAARLACARAWH